MLEDKAFVIRAVDAQPPPFIVAGMATQPPPSLVGGVAAMREVVAPPPPSIVGGVAAWPSPSVMAVDGCAAIPYVVVGGGRTITPFIVGGNHPHLCWEGVAAL